MKAVNSNILVQDIKDDSCVQKIGEFVIPEGNNDFRKVKVISVGEKVEADIKEGDTLFVYSNCGKTFSYSLEEFRLINISEVIVVL